jgi:hypothetical protein
MPTINKELAYIKLLVNELQAMDNMLSNGDSTAALCRVRTAASLASKSYQAYALRDTSDNNENIIEQKLAEQTAYIKALEKENIELSAKCESLSSGGSSLVLSVSYGL